MALLNEFLNDSQQAFLSSLQTVEALCRNFKSARSELVAKIAIEHNKNVRIFLKTKQAT